jgi:hypothetical protein
MKTRTIFQFLGLGLASLSMHLLLPSCAKEFAPYSMEYHPAVAGDSQYSEIYQKWTQKNHFHRHMAETYMFDVTFFSPEFRQAYLREWVEKKQLPKDTQRELVAAELEKGEKYFEFLFSWYISDASKMDLGEKTSQWTVYLINSRGERAEIHNVEHLGKTTSIDRYFFPHINRWNELYRLKFLKEVGGKPFLQNGENRFQLVFTGLEAEVKFEWKL